MYSLVNKLKATEAYTYKEECVLWEFHLNKTSKQKP